MAAPPLTGNWTDVQVGLDSNGNPIIPDLTNRRRAHALDINNIAHSVIAQEGQFAVGHKASGSHTYRGINLKEEGCFCDLTHDDTTLAQSIINAAAGKYPVIIPYPGIKANLILPEGTNIGGEFRSLNLSDTGNGQGRLGSFIIGATPTVPVIRFPTTTQAEYWAFNFGFRRTLIHDLGIIGNGSGSHCIYAQTGAIELEIDHVYCVPGASNADGIFLQEFVQDCYIHDSRVDTGRYGYHNGIGRQWSDGTYALNCFDKCFISNCKFQGQSINGIYVQTQTGGDSEFNRCDCINVANDGMVLEGFNNGITIVSPNFEGTGYGVARTAVTTGSITHNTNVLTLASGLGFQVGDTLTIQGAALDGIGRPGADMYAVLRTLSGVTATLYNQTNTAPLNAGVDVTNVDVRNAVFCPITMTSGTWTNGPPPASVTIVGGRLSATSAWGTRYAFDGGALVGPTSHIISSQTTAPIYDPSGYVMGLGISIAPAAGPDDLFRRMPFAKLAGTTTGTLGDLQAVVRSILLRGARSGFWTDGTS